ncbi:MAG: hypothetical protein ABF904_14625 [Ethanoligenens sp.]
MRKEDPIDRGRMQEPLDEWEREAEERLRQRANRQAVQEAAAQAIAESPPDTEIESAADARGNGLQSDLHEDSSTDDGDSVDLQQEEAPVAEPDKDEPLKSDNADETEPDEQLPSRHSKGAGLAGLLTVELILFVVFLLLVGAVTFHYPLPSVLRFLGQTDKLVVVEAALFVLAGVFAIHPLVEGFVALFSLRRKTSSAAVLAFLGGIAGFIPAFMQGAGVRYAAPYALSACACLSLETFSRLLTARACRVSAAAIEKTENPHSVFVKETKIGPTGRVQRVVVPGNVSPAPATQDAGSVPTGRSASVISLVALVISAAAAGIAVFLYGKSAVQGVLLFAAFASAGAPLVMGFCGSLPMLAATRALRKRGAALSGYGAVRAFGRADAVFLPERLLYPAGQVKICALRPMCKDGVESAVLMAASVASAAQTAMAPAILGLFEGGEALLRPVAQLQVIDEMGIEAWVDGKRVLLGSRNLLRQKRVNLTGRMLLEVEAKYAVKGNDFVYLVVGDTLTALFVLDYIPEKRVRSALRGLVRTGIHVMVGTADANITREQVGEQFRLKKHAVRILSHQQAEVVMAPASGRSDGAGLYLRDDAVSFARAVAACVRLESTARVAAILQVIGVLVNLFLAGAVFWLAGRELQPLEVLTIQVIWALPPVLFALFRRHV